MSITTLPEEPRNAMRHIAAPVGMPEPTSRHRNVTRQPVRAGRRLMIVAATVLTGVAAVLLTSGGLGWPSRPALPGDWFQLAAGVGTMPPMHATPNESMARAWPTRYPMARVAKGEGWM
jgi:hypothetical protein